MTVLSTPTPGRSDTATAGEERRPVRALSLRRWFLIASPVLAGLFGVVGAYFDPAATISGSAMYEIYADEPGPLQLKSLGFHWSYAFWMLPALLIAPYVRGRGAALANVTAFVGFAGMTTLPGLLIVDYYDSAIGQLYGVEATDAVSKLMEDTMWGLPVFALPGMVGLLLSLPLTAITLWRAGLARWWGIVPVLAGFAAFDLSGITWWGCLLMTACYAGFAWVLHRATDPARQPA